LIIQSVTNPIFANLDGTAIMCEVKFEEFNEVHPFLATAWDTELHGIEIYNNLKAGKYGEINAFVQPPEGLPTAQPITTGTKTV
jgi:hypothetical protein